MEGLSKRRLEIGREGEKISEVEGERGSMKGVHWSRF